MVHKTLLTTSGRAQSIPTYNIQPYTYRWRAGQTETGAWPEEADAEHESDEKQRAKARAGSRSRAAGSGGAGRAGPAGPRSADVNSSFVSRSSGSQFAASSTAAASDRDRDRAHSFSSPATARTFAQSASGDSSSVSFFSVSSLPVALHDLTRTHTTQLDTDRNASALAALDAEFERIRASYPLNRTRPPTHSPERTAATNKLAFEERGRSPNRNNKNPAGTGPALTAADVANAPPYATGDYRQSLRQETAWAVDRKSVGGEEHDPTLDIGMASAHRNAPTGFLNVDARTGSGGPRIVNGPPGPTPHRPKPMLFGSGSHSARASPVKAAAPKPKARRDDEEVKRADDSDEQAGVVRTTAKTQAIAAATARKRAASAGATRRFANSDKPLGPRDAAGGGGGGAVPSTIADRMTLRNAMVQQKRAETEQQQLAFVAEQKQKIRAARTKSYEESKSGDARVLASSTPARLINAPGSSSVRKASKSPQKTVRPTQLGSPMRVARQTSGGSGSGDEALVGPAAPPPVSASASSAAPAPLLQQHRSNGAVISVPSVAAPAPAPKPAVAAAAEPSNAAPAPGDGDREKRYLWREHGSWAWSNTAQPTSAGGGAATTATVPDSEAAARRARAKAASYRAAALATRPTTQNASPLRQPRPGSASARAFGRSVPAPRSRSYLPNRPYTSPNRRTVDSVTGMIRQFTHDNQPPQQQQQQVAALSRSTPSTRGGGGAIRVLGGVPDPVTAGGLTQSERARRVQSTTRQAADHYTRAVVFKKEHDHQLRREEGLLDAVYWRYQRDVLGDRGVQNWEHAQYANGGTAQRREVLADDFSKALHEYRLHNAHFQTHHLLPNPQAAQPHKQHQHAAAGAPSGGAAAYQTANVRAPYAGSPQKSGGAAAAAVDTSTFAPPQHNGSFVDAGGDSSVFASPSRR